MIPFQPADPSLQWLAQLVFAGLLVFFALLQRLQFQLRNTEGNTWWASNGRDLVNGVSVLLMAWGLRTLGYSGPLAIGVAAVMIILGTAIQPALGEGKVGLRA